MDLQVLLNSFLAKQIRHFISLLAGFLVGMDFMQQSQANGFVEVNTQILSYMVLQVLALLWSYAAGKIKA